MSIVLESRNVFVSLAAAAVLAISCTSIPAKATPSIDPDDFNIVGDANWEIDQGSLRADKGNGFFVTKNSYENFHLKVEFFASKDTNSGVFFRCVDETKITDQSCYEANIFDQRPDQTYRTGAVTNYAHPKFIVNAEDSTWHSYEVIAEGDKFQIYLDGKETVFFRNDTHKMGKIALQFAKGGIQFRNLEIKDLRLPTNKKSVLDGVWELESMYSIDRAGKTTPWCVGSYGVIIYSEGVMSTAVNCTSDASKVLLYSGQFRIEGAAVFHLAQNYSNPGLNRVHRRTYLLKEENRLELRGDLGESTVVVNWVRR